MSDISQLAQSAKAWPFEQARLLTKRLARQGRTDGEVIFQTGYGPSGLPHIGTFGEVARTNMVRHAFEVMTQGAYTTRLIAFSDDMDGFRKVPPNLPQQKMLHQHLGLPLSKVPDPFGKHESFSAHNNARLCAFLDQFGFSYEFISSTQMYTSGAFDPTLRTMLERFDAVMAIMLPTLGAERQATYSPFLPISPVSGQVLQVPVIERDVAAGTISFEDVDGKIKQTPVTGGRVKVQWKPDWALRWRALAVDYEMSGKDLIESVRQSSKICRALGGTPPDGFNYELFLDENSEKISKSKGNGLSVEQWLSYGLPQSLSHFMFQKPKTAKKLFFDVIPKNTDEYLQHLAAFAEQDDKAKLGNPVWHIHEGKPPTETSPISFSLLLNLASAASAETKQQMWGFISQYVEGANAKTHPLLDDLVGFAITYFHDFVLPEKSFRLADAREKAAMLDLIARLQNLPQNERDSQILQTEVFAAGKAAEFENLRDWFCALYEVLLGQKTGPRFGSFVAIYGKEQTIKLIQQALDGQLVRP
ncbi:Lysyl-tRNA synthetase (class I) [hydrothermal vent metagenome]|uniref:Lysine--tRNA ligase n=1 Tax=hydrothermal vent metagenome TaxID=652676 RepID=A0A3B0R7I1_9ZZZZ